MVNLSATTGCLNALASAVRNEFAHISYKLHISNHVPIYATSLMTPPASLIFCSASLETNRVLTMKGRSTRPLPN